MTRPSTHPLLNTVVARLHAALLVVLCILPTTAPFSTLGSFDSSPSGNADTAIGGPETHASVADADDNDTLLLERSHFLKQSRLCALIPVSSCDVAAVLFLSGPAVAPITFVLTSSSLPTVLRV